MATDESVPMHEFLRVFNESWKFNKLFVTGLVYEAHNSSPPAEMFETRR